MARYRNGMQDPDATEAAPFGIGLPDASQDTYQVSAPSVQQGWPSKVNDQSITVPASQPGTPGPSTYAPPSAQAEQIRAQHSEPPPPEPQLSKGEVLALAVHQALSRSPIGSLLSSFGTVGPNKKIADYQRARTAYQDRQHNEERQFQMRPKPPTAEEAELADIARISADPDVIESRERSKAGPLGRAEYRVGLEKAKEGVKQPGKMDLLNTRMSEAEKRLQERLDAKEPRQPSDYERYAADARAAGRKPSWSDYQQSKSGLGAAGSAQGRAEFTPDKAPKEKPSDAETVRQGYLRRGELGKLKKFDEETAASALADTQAKKTAQGAAKAKGPGEAGHGPLNTQSGQEPTQPSGLKPNWRYKINGKEVTTDAAGNVLQ